jgi:hypothetical protein
MGAIGIGVPAEIIEPLGGGVPGSIDGGVIGGASGYTQGLLATIAYESTVGQAIFMYDQRQDRLKDEKDCNRIAGINM